MTVVFSSDPMMPEPLPLLPPVTVHVWLAGGFSTVMPVYKTILVIKSAGNNGD